MSLNDLTGQPAPEDASAELKGRVLAERIFHALTEAHWLNNAQATGSIEILRLIHETIRASNHKCKDIGYRINGIATCGECGKSLGWVQHGQGRVMR